MTTITTDTIKVKVQGISNEIEAKIDTGADQSSLHGQSVTIKDEHVIFELNDRVYRAPLEHSQDISSADGGTKSRPVIKATIEIEGQDVETLLNINDRSEMPQQLLIGQDVIKAAGLTLKFSSEGKPDDAAVEQEEVNGQADTQSQEAGPDEPPIVNPAATAMEEVEEQVLELTEQIMAMHNHITSLTKALNDVRVQTLKLLRSVGGVPKPIVPETQQAAQSSKPETPTVFTPYEPK